MKNILKKIRLPKLPNLPKFPRFKSKTLAFKILTSVIVLIILITFLYGLGIYKFGWSRYGVKTMAKIVPYPAAFVGPSWITFSEFYRQRDFIEHFYIKTISPLPEEAEFNRAIIDRLIEQKLVEKEFKKLDFQITQKDIEDEYKKIVEQNQGEENIKNMLKDLYGMSIKDFKRLIGEKLTVERFKNEGLVSIHLYHIVIKDEGRAKDVLNQINAGADFSEMAKKFSEDEVSKDKGGDLGWVQRGGIISGKPMPKEFELAAFSLSVGQISSAPVSTEFGFHIFKVTEKKGKIDKSYLDWFTETKNRTWIKKFIGK